MTTTNDKRTATPAELPEGRFQCFLRTEDGVLRFYLEGLKIILPLTIDVGGEHIEHDQFMTVDGSLVTAGGKKRAKFTTDALEVLGAVDPGDAIADALDAGQSIVTLPGLLPARWVECVVKHSNGYVDVSIYKPKADAAAVKKATSGLRGLSGKGAATSKSPFAAPPRGTAIAPPVARPAPVAPPRAPAPPTEADTSFP
jgi:hypothetical protein